MIINSLFICCILTGMHIGVTSGYGGAWLGGCWESISQGAQHRCRKFLEAPGISSVEVPSGYVKIAMERSTIFNGKIHYFDWAIFNSYVAVYQRVGSGQFQSRATPDVLACSWFQSAHQSATAAHRRLA